MRPAPLSVQLVTASDGAPLELAVSPEGPEDARWILLLGAPGTPPSFWTHQIAHLAGRHRLAVLTLAEVRTPSGRSRSDALRLRRDVAEALDALGASEVLTVSWGLGAQMALDLAGSSEGRRVAGLVLINPLLMPRFARALGVLGGDPVGPLFGRLAARATPLLAQAHRRLGGLVDAGAWLRRAGLASSTIEREALLASIDELGRESNAGIGQVLRALEEQRQAPELEAIEAPTLVVVGEADVVASELVARRIGRRMPHGEILTIKGGTHLTPLEYPEFVALAIERFARGLATAPHRGS